MLTLLSGVFLLAALGLAVVIGGRVERQGAAIIVVNVVAGLVASAALSSDPYVVAACSIDVATALAFGVLAVRNPDKLWPGVAGVGVTFVMVFSATKAIGFPLNETAHVAALNLAGAIVHGSLAIGAVLERRGRRERLQAELAPA